jgi:hypothetical protein
MYLNPDHPRTCQTCAVSSAEDRARLEAWLIARGMMDATSASKSL